MVAGPSAEPLRRDWRALRIAPEAPVREAIRSIDRGRVGLALVMEGERLIGTVTDGDVRRAILRETSLDSPVSGIMERRFVSLPQGAGRGQALALMERHKIRQVPVLDAEARVEGLYYLPDLLGAPAQESWVVLMAGGRGIRLHPLTENTPKPMLPVEGRPLLEKSLTRLVDAGFTRIFIALNYRGEQIEAHFGDGGRFGCSIEYLREQQPLDTGGALGLLPEAPRAPLLVVNGDVLTDVDFAALLDYHLEHHGVATLCVRELVQEVPYGVVRCEGEVVVRMDEKPSQRLLINAGIYVLEPEVVARVTPGQPRALPALIDEALAAGGAVHAFLVHEPWIDIGLPRDYERVRDGGAA